MVYYQVLTHGRLALDGRGLGDFFTPTTACLTNETVDLGTSILILYVIHVIPSVTAVDKPSVALIHCRPR